MSDSGPFQLRGYQRWGLTLLLLLLSIPAMLPLVWMVSTSLKVDAQIYAAQDKGMTAISLASLLPQPVRWRNYPTALRRMQKAIGRPGDTRAAKPETGETEI